MKKKMRFAVRSHSHSCQTPPEGKAIIFQPNSTKHIQRKENADERVWRVSNSECAISLSSICHTLKSAMPAKASNNLPTYPVPPSPPFPAAYAPPHPPHADVAHETPPPSALEVVAHKSPP